MQLYIQGPNQLINKEFGQWLCSRISLKLISSIRKYNLTSIEEYINKTETIPRLYKRAYKVSEVIIFAAQNLSCIADNGYIILRFDTTKFVPGFDRVKLLALIKLINYGNLEVKGCHIFTDVLRSIENDITYLVKQFYRI